MYNIYVKDIIDKINGTLICGDMDEVLENFSKDTRTIRKNDIYIGIKGENFDGNLLYKEALEKAKGCILNKETELDREYISKLKNKFIVLVDNTVLCLQKLAAIKRDLCDIPVVCITGSVGKTSTKDIIASVLSKKYNVLKTEGNYNNHIGVPLTILNLKNENCMVIEMGMNNLGEISLLSKIARPTVAVITNVGTAHIGNLGSRENILKAKLEICDGLEGILIINNDNDLLHNYYLNNKRSNIITFGIENNSNYMATNIKMDTLRSTFDVNINNKEYSVVLNVPGKHFVLNALCALSVGKYFEISIDLIKEGIANFDLTRKRMEIEKINYITIINDCYNANLDSMQSSITYLGSLPHRHIAVLGDMLELGKYTETLHKEVGHMLVQNKVDIAVVVGNYAKFVKKGALELGFNKKNIYIYDNNEEAAVKLAKLITKNDSILLKASNGMHFNEIYEYLKKELR